MVHTCLPSADECAWTGSVPELRRRGTSEAWGVPLCAPVVGSWAEAAPVAHHVQRPRTSWRSGPAHRQPPPPPGAPAKHQRGWQGMKPCPRAVFLCWLCSASQHCAPSRMQGIGTEGVEALGKALSQSKSVSQLCIGNNPLGDEGRPRTQKKWRQITCTSIACL